VFSYYRFATNTGCLSALSQSFLNINTNLTDHEHGLYLSCDSYPDPVIHQTFLFCGESGRHDPQSGVPRQITSDVELNEE
jgi:hypothetical protein